MISRSLTGLFEPSQTVGLSNLQNLLAETKDVSYRRRYRIKNRNTRQILTDVTGDF